MKKLVFIVLAALILTGCTTGEKDKNSGTNKVPVENTQGENVIVSVDMMEEEFLDLNTYSLENKETTDGQPEFLFQGGASSDLGLYYWEYPRGRLMYFDKASKVQVPLCNRPNCKHEDETCNADFYSRVIGPVNIYRSMIYYHGESVYIVGDDSDSYVNLYRVAPDGSSWEKYMTLFKAEKTITIDGNSTSVEWRRPTVILHKDFVYYVDESESMPKLRRIQMGGSEINVVAESQGERAMLYRIKAYGDFVFFQSAYYVGEDFFGGIYAYNVKNGEVVLVKENAVRDYYIVDNVLYYEKETIIYKYDLKTGEQKALPVKCKDGPWNYYLVDKNGLYVIDCESGGCLDIYDKNGVLQKSFSDARITDCCFGVDGYFLGELERLGHAVLKVEDVLKGDGEWICFPGEE